MFDNTSGNKQEVRTSKKKRTTRRKMAKVGYSGKDFREMLHQGFFDQNDSDTNENDEAIARALQNEADYQDENEYLKPRKSYRQTKTHKPDDSRLQDELDKISDTCNWLQSNRSELQSDFFPPLILNETYPKIINNVKDVMEKSS